LEKGNGVRDIMKVLFVCMGNICRSPTAHGVFEALVAQRNLAHRISVDSAGTHGYHTNQPPDPRTQQAARGRGYDLSGLRARQVVEADFLAFDLIAAMDRHNLDWLTKRCPPAHQHKLRLFLEFASGVAEREVPDPYYGGPQGFLHVLDLVEHASRGLIDEILARG
jgi:protein-tyrosine phosphatase